MAWNWVWGKKRDNSDIKIFDPRNWKVEVAINCQDEDC